jgi:hypothetical protein
MDEDLLRVSRNRLAERITGGLSKPSKMPESAWGIPAVRCKLGAVLTAVEGSVCSTCYARKGRYRLGHVKDKLDERYRGLEHPLWVPAMVLLIRWYVGRYFRWFDSGDLQCMNHLHNVCEVARHTPDILHWLPTQEHDLVRRYDGDIPGNLTIRVSAQMLDGDVPSWWPHTSSVFTTQPPEDAHVCPAQDHDNFCGPCRACWDRKVTHVSYRQH